MKSGVRVATIQLTMTPSVAADPRRQGNGTAAAAALCTRLLASRLWRKRTSCYDRTDVVVGRLMRPMGVFSAGLHCRCRCRVPSPRKTYEVHHVTASEKKINGKPPACGADHWERTCEVLKLTYTLYKKRVTRRFIGVFEFYWVCKRRKAGRE